MKKTKILAIVLAVAMMVGTLSGCMSNKVVAQIGDIKISSKIFNFLIENYRAQVEQSDSSFASNPDKWNTYKVDDKYAIDMARENAKESVTQLVVYLKKAQEENITLTEDEIKKVDSDISSEIEQMGGEDAFNTAAAKLGINKDDYRQIRQYSALLTKMNTEIEKKVNVDDDTLKETFLSDYAGAKHILIKTIDDNGNDLSQDQITAARTKAESILKQIQDGADFDEMVKEYSEDKSGDTVNADVMVFTKGQMVEEFETAAFNLKVGEVSEVVRTQYGYHIIKRYDISGDNYFTDHKDDVKNTLLEDKVSSEYDKWKKEYKDDLKMNDKYIDKYTFKANTTDTASDSANGGTTSGSTTNDGTTGTTTTPSDTAGTATDGAATDGETTSSGQ